MAVAWPPEAARRLGRGDERDELLQIELQTRCYRRATEEQQKGRFGGPKGESERPRVCDHGAKLHTTLLPARRLDWRRVVCRERGSASGGSESNIPAA